MKTFTYWKVVEIMPGVTCEILRQTITSKEGFFNKIVEVIKTQTDFMWVMEETIVIDSRDRSTE
jgi:hypothetical protein